MLPIARHSLPEEDWLLVLLWAVGSWQLAVGSWQLRLYPASVRCGNYFQVMFSVDLVLVGLLFMQKISLELKIKSIFINIDLNQC
ncbi:hypothetical protein ACTL6P_01610 [Endozoicomonas acroporae]|uniref:hypothetical protein n=1 Tax=Endozoicomonas acroporae TaxID=1701104 RepID=UPI000C764DEB|nr:hypothetical protein [Endozoicomonas acroporae]